MNQSTILWTIVGVLAAIALLLYIFQEVSNR